MIFGDWLPGEKGQHAQYLHTKEDKRAAKALIVRLIWITTAFLVMRSLCCLLLLVGILVVLRSTPKEIVVIEKRIIVTHYHKLLLFL